MSIDSKEFLPEDIFFSDVLGAISDVGSELFLKLQTKVAVVSLSTYGKCGGLIAWVTTTSW